MARYLLQLPNPSSCSISLYQGAPLFPKIFFFISEQKRGKHISWRCCSHSPRSLQGAAMLLLHPAGLCPLVCAISTGDDAGDPLLRVALEGLGSEDQITCCAPRSSARSQTQREAREGFVSRAIPKPRAFVRSAIKERFCFPSCAAPHKSSPSQQKAKPFNSALI